MYPDFLDFFWYSMCRHRYSKYIQIFNICAWSSKYIFPKKIYIYGHQRTIQDLYYAKKAIQKYYFYIVEEL